MSVIRNDPYKNFNFLVDLGDGEQRQFDLVSPPSGAIAVVEYREGGEKELHPRRLPGRTEYDNVVLRRGVTGRTELYDWWNDARKGAVTKRNVVITLLDEQRDAVLVWKLVNAWPVELAWSVLEGLGDEVLHEEVELTYDSFEVE